jgi:four helix bundle protein
MTYKGFENLEVWQRSKTLTIMIFTAFKGCKEYGLKDQIIRSSLSIASNIAEGYERKSEKEFLQFLHYSKGSTAELKTQLIIAGQSGIIDPTKAKNLVNETTQIASMLEGLVKSIKQNL